MRTTPLQLAVIGATGRVGSLLVEYALEAGHVVTAVARSPDRLASLRAALMQRFGAGVGTRLHVVEADVLDPEEVRIALHGCDVVLSALAAPSLEQPGSTLSAGMRNIVAALASGARDVRIIAIAGAGVLDDEGGRLRLESPDFPDVYRAMSREHAGALQALRESPLAWVLVCPTDMPSGERTRRYRTAVERMPQGAQAVPAGDVADFMVREAVERRYDRVRVGIAR